MVWLLKLDKSSHKQRVFHRITWYHCYWTHTHWCANKTRKKNGIRSRIQNESTNIENPNDTYWFRETWIHCSFLSILSSRFQFIINCSLISPFIYTHFCSRSLKPAIKEQRIVHGYISIIMIVIPYLWNTSAWDNKIWMMTINQWIVKYLKHIELNIIFY